MDKQSVLLKTPRFELRVHDERCIGFDIESDLCDLSIKIRDLDWMEIALKSYGWQVELLYNGILKTAIARVPTPSPRRRGQVRLIASVPSTTGALIMAVNTMTRRGLRVADLI